MGTRGQQHELTEHQSSESTEHQRLDLLHVVLRHERIVPRGSVDAQRRHVMLPVEPGVLAAQSCN
jgi:hypothetical protein